MMIFRKDIEPCCIYCKHATRISPEIIACAPRGAMPTYGACKKFVYDPLKRLPERPRKLLALHIPEDAEQFTL